MANIIPSILTSDVAELEQKLFLVSELVEWAQVDLMDGEFVKNVSVKPEELKSLNVPLNLEAHLMVKNPSSWLAFLDPDFFKRVYFHFEAVPEPGELIREIKRREYEVGLALNPETPLSVLEPLAEHLDGILLMSVNPGWQKQQFIPEVLDKIKECSVQFPEPDLAVDGGINESNIAAVAEAGATNICVGSAIFAGGDVAGNIQRLKDKLQ